MHATSYYIFLTLMAIANSSFSQQSVAAQLGYPADARLLIIHADDLGVSHSENMASFEAFENGSVNSASIMMPTPWVTEVADYVKANPEHDFGLHLVLSSEWKNYKWGPVASLDKVPSLVNEQGYFRENCISDLNIAEVEIELKAQIDRAIAMGIEPTHLDTHMGCLAQTLELIQVYLKMGQLYNMPVLANNQVPKALRDQFDVKVLIDELFMITPQDFSNGAANYYIDVLNKLKPGLSIILVHTAYDNDEMQGMCIDHPAYGSEWRQQDFDFFTSDECKQLIESEGIKLVTWREIKEALY
ncbi:MAG: polysaccharide deacetylase family protein [Cyclobacteriaceae bacterium]